MKVGIVGSGIAGLAAAMRLSSLASEIELFDRNRVGSGASSGAMGTITPFSDHDAVPSTVALAIQNTKILNQVVRQVEGHSGIDCGFRRCGTLEFFADEREIDHVRDRLQYLNELDSEIQIISKQQIGKIQPGVATFIEGAVFYPNEYELSHFSILKALKSYLTSVGIIFSENTNVESVISNNTGVSIQTCKSEKQFDYVIISAGADHNSIAGSKPIPLQKILGEVVSARVWNCEAPNFNLYRGRSFIAPKKDGRVLLGSNYDPDCDTNCRNVQSISLRSMKDTLNGAAEIFPGIENLEVEGVWRNWRPKLPDAQPVVDCDDSGRIIVVNGLYGLGYTLSFGIADLIVKFIQSGVVHEEMNKFMLHDRFKEARQ